MNENKPIDLIGYALIVTIFILLAYSGYLSYKSIDPTVLKRLETTPLVLPTPVSASPSATIIK